MTNPDTNIRTKKLDAAVSAAGELVGLLMKKGAVTPQQASVLVMAAARAAVSNVRAFEVKASALRVAAELEGSGS